MDFVNDPRWRFSDKNPEDNKISINGLRVNYKSIGNGKVSILLLHGWGLNSDKYVETAKRFVIHDPRFLILIPDLPGFGQSAKPSKAWNVDDYAEFSNAFADALNLNNLILIGHSFGGRLAIKLAAKHPEKLKAIILTGAAGIRHKPSLRQKIFFYLAKIGKTIFSYPLLDRLQKPAQKILYEAAREKDYFQAEGVMKETFKNVIAEDLSSCLYKIKIPALLIWGRKDHSTPLSDAFAMRGKIKNAELKIIDGANHSLPYRQPEIFSETVAEFIKINLR